jgi:hypothetical protein
MAFPFSPHGEAKKFSALLAGRHSMRQTHYNAFTCYCPAIERLTQPERWLSLEGIRQ